MDLELTPDGVEVAGLARVILDKHCTPERLREVERGQVRFDHDLWRRFADSGLVSLTVPEEHNGSELGILELCAVLVEVGRKVAALPLAVHGVTALALARFGTAPQQARWLPPGGLGEFVLSTALAEERTHSTLEPVTRAEGDGRHWLLTGSKAVVPAGPLADLFVVPATTAQGLTVFLVHADDPGVVVVPQHVTGSELSARLELDRAAVPIDRVLGTIGDGRPVVDWLTAHLTVAVCAQQVGTVEGALELTASYAASREQFGRPIGSFQAVAQRLADGYVDAQAARLTMWQAAWALSEGHHAAREVAVAKLWAADAGHRVAHSAVHVHGGVGIDLDGQAHRYFTAAKRQELLLGGATEQARAIGRLLAGEGG